MSLEKEKARNKLSTFFHNHNINSTTVTDAALTAEKSLVKAGGGAAALTGLAYGILHGVDYWADTKTVDAFNNGFKDTIVNNLEISAIVAGLVYMLPLLVYAAAKYMEKQAEQYAEDQATQNAPKNDEEALLNNYDYHANALLVDWQKKHELLNMENVKQDLDKRCADIGLDRGRLMDCIERLISQSEKLQKLGLVAPDEEFNNRSNIITSTFQHIKDYNPKPTIPG